MITRKQPFVDDLPFLYVHEPGLAPKGAQSAHLLLNGVEADVRLVPVRRLRFLVPHFVCPGCGRAKQKLYLHQRRFLCSVCLGAHYRNRTGDNSALIARHAARRDKAQAKVDYYDRKIRALELKDRLAQLKREQK